MQPEKDQSEPIAPKDDDIQFDRKNITTTDSQAPDPEVKPASAENTILPNEELENKGAVVPLSEEEKQPKLGDKEELPK